MTRTKVRLKEASFENLKAWIDSMEDANEGNLYVLNVVIEMKVIKEKNEASK